MLFITVPPIMHISHYRWRTACRAFVSQRITCATCAACKCLIKRQVLRYELNSIHCRRTCFSLMALSAAP